MTPGDREPKPLEGYELDLVAQLVERHCSAEFTARVRSTFAYLANPDPLASASLRPQNEEENDDQSRLAKPVVEPSTGSTASENQPVPPIAPEREICICAAIKCVREGRVVRGHRHNHCIRTAVEMMVDPTLAVQGFITSRNRFVDREEGLLLQVAAGIVSKDCVGYRGNVLFSEDLY